MSKRDFWIVIGVVVLMAISPVSVFAQDGSGLEPILELFKALENWEILVTDMTYLPFAASLVFFLVAITKRVFKGIAAAHINAFWSVVVFGLYSVSQHYGYAIQFETLAPLIAAVGSALLGITLTSAAATYGYKKANRFGVPFAYSRGSQAMGEPEAKG